MFCFATLGYLLAGVVKGIDGKPVIVEDLKEYFHGDNCPTLMGKPKVFLIQACQGGTCTFFVQFFHCLW